MGAKSETFANAYICEIVNNIPSTDDCKVSTMVDTTTGCRIHSFPRALWCAVTCGEKQDICAHDLAVDESFSFVFLRKAATL